MGKTSSAVRTFTNSQFGSIRTMEREDVVWFVGKDIAMILGHANPERAIRKYVDDEDKVVTEMVTSFGNKNTTFINESGLYSLILSSKLPKAKEFKHWVTSEVLPSVRKHGVYMTPQTLTESLKNPDSLITILETLKAEQEKSASLAETVTQQEKQLEELKPKGEYYDIVLATRCSISFSTNWKSSTRTTAGGCCITLSHRKGLQSRIHIRLWITMVDQIVR